MNKRNLLERRYIIEILGLILNGIKTNQKIADKLEKNRSTISDQVNFLKKNNPKFKNVKIEEITLKNIFSEAYKLLLFTFRSEKKELITMRRDLPMYDTEGKKIFGISGFNFKANDEEKKEFLSFLDGLYKDHLKRKVEYRI